MSGPKTPTRLLWGRAVIGAVLLAAGVVAAACAGRLERVTVAGTSMAPTLLPGDRLLAWSGRTCAPGDLVLVATDDRTAVKRVLTVTDTTVEIAGDNPAASTDSRSLGPLPRDAVRGRVMYRYAPARRVGWLTD